MKRLSGLLVLLSIVTLLSSCGGSYKKPVATVGEQELLYEELRFEVLTYLDDHKDATEEELRAVAEQRLKETCALLSLCAEHIPETQLDSNAMEALVDAELQKAIAALGDENAFEDYLKEVYMTEHLMRRRLAITQMQIELENKLFKGTKLESRDTLIGWLDQGNYVRVRRIFIPLSVGAEGADAIRGRLVSGTKLTELFTPEEKQAGAKYFPAEYYFRGLRGGDPESELLNLMTEGQVSSLIADTEGYTCYIRVDNDRATLVDYQAVTVLEQYREKEFAPILEARAAELTLSWNEYGASLILKDID